MWAVPHLYQYTVCPYSSKQWAGFAESRLRSRCERGKSITAAGAADFQKQCRPLPCTVDRKRPGAGIVAGAEGVRKLSVNSGQLFPKGEGCPTSPVCRLASAAS